MFERILVPLDGSKAAEGVLPYVKKLAFKTGGESVLLHVIDPEVSLNSPVYSDCICGGPLNKPRGKHRTS